MNAQLGFDALLAQSDASNKERHDRRTYAHLPEAMDEALLYFRALVDRHHAAMIAGDIECVRTLRDEAHNLAYKLNDYAPGIIADEDSPGCALERLTAAQDGQVPLWGQSGSFMVIVGTMRVRIEIDGLFGICASSMAWMGFSAHAVDHGKPFLSETGFRSFLGAGGALRPGYTPDTFAVAIIEAYLAKELKGRLRSIDPKYR